MKSHKNELIAVIIVSVMAGGWILLVKWFFENDLIKHLILGG